MLSNHESNWSQMTAPMIEPWALIKIYSYLSSVFNYWFPITIKRRRIDVDYFDIQIFVINFVNVHLSTAKASEKSLKFFPFSSWSWFEYEHVNWRTEIVLGIRTFVNLRENKSCLFVMEYNETKSEIEEREKRFKHQITSQTDTLNSHPKVTLPAVKCHHHCVDLPKWINHLTFPNVFVGMTKLDT